MCSRRTFIVSNWGNDWSSALDSTFLVFGEKLDSCGSPGSLLSWYQEISPKKKVWINYAALVVPSFSLQWKSDEITKDYLTQMLLAINWRYWQAGKKFTHAYESQGRLMQVHFIKIHQVFAKKKKSDTFLTE